MDFDFDEEYEELDFVQPHQKYQVNLLVSEANMFDPYIILPTADGMDWYMQGDPPEDITYSNHT